jgi:hypothetical protein
MKKVIFSLFVLSFLTACAGNPPAWWNPGNVYSNMGRQNVSTEKQQRSQPTQEDTSFKEAEETPSEVSISVADESYEEMALAPLQDEENEEVNGESSAQSVSNPEEDIPELGENPADEDFSAQPATDTASGGLPLPSVLE